MKNSMGSECQLLEKHLPLLIYTIARSPSLILNNAPPTPSGFKNPPLIVAYKSPLSTSNLPKATELGSSYRVLFSFPANTRTSPVFPSTLTNSFESYKPVKILRFLSNTKSRAKVILDLVISASFKGRPVSGSMITRAMIPCAVLEK